MFKNLFKKKEVKKTTVKFLDCKTGKIHEVVLNDQETFNKFMLSENMLLTV